MGVATGTLAVLHLHDFSFQFGTAYYSACAGVSFAFIASFVLYGANQSLYRLEFTPDSAALLPAVVAGASPSVASHPTAPPPMAGAYGNYGTGNYGTYGSFPPQYPLPDGYQQYLQVRK